MNTRPFQGSAQDRQSPPRVLVFAGLDPGGGAGLQADIETFQAHGIHALPVATALTAQDTHDLHALWPTRKSILQQQLTVLCDDIIPQGIKIGLIGSLDVAVIIAEHVDRLRKNQPELTVVLDPVLASGGGRATADETLVRFIAEQLLPRASLITPNQAELQRLADASSLASDNILEAATEITRLHCNGCLLTGGDSDTLAVENHLFHSGNQVRSWQWPRLPGRYHGTGCSLASALSAQLLLGCGLEDAASKAQDYSWRSIKQGFAIGHGQSIPRRQIQP